MHRAGFRTVAACEIDPWRRERFAENFPAARLYNDVHGLTGCRLRDDGISPINIVVGSPPCQDASIGRREKRTGIDGARTGLFWEFLRIVREVRPNWVCAESVPGLVGVGADRIAADLEKSGYRVWILNIGAEDFGATHERRRLWYVALADADEKRLQDARRVAGATGPDRIGAAFGSLQAAWNPWRAGESDAVRMADGLPAQLALGQIIGAFGDAVVPQITEAIGRAIRAIEQEMRPA